RKIIYVSNDGSDNNSGLSPQLALRTLDKARTLVGDNTEILLNRGDTFTLSNTLLIKGINVVIGAYGTGDNPRVNWAGATGYSPVMSTDLSARDVTIQDITFDKESDHDAISAGGKNITVRGVQFLNVGYGVNANKKPTGLLVQDSSAPTETGMT